MSVTLRSATAAPRDLLFHQPPVRVLSLAGVLYVAVFVFRMQSGSPVDAYSMLYVLPVALVATAFGLRGGLAASVLAVLLIVTWALTRDVSLSVTGWGSRVVPMLLLGVLLGEATDRIRRTEGRMREMAVAAQMHREAIEINDSLIQGMVASRWAFEAGQVDAGLQTLGDTISRAQDLVSGLIRQADMGGRTEKLPDTD